MRGVRILILLLVCWCQIGRAQVNPEIYNFWENPYYVNPANIHYNCLAYLTLNTRAQWVDFPGAPFTANLTAAFPVDKLQSQFAGRLFVDKIGITNTVEFLLSYAYSLKLTPNHYLSFGTSAAIQSRTYDYGKIDVTDKVDPIIYSEKINGLLEGNLSLGLEYCYKGALKVGFSTRNLMSYFPKLRQNRTNPLQASTHTLYAKYLTGYMGESNFYMDFGACYRNYDARNIGDFMTSFYYDLNNDYALQFQLMGGTAGDIGFTFGVNLFSDLKLLCSYNYNYAIVNRHSYGTFEIMLTYEFERCPTCYNVW